MNQYTVTFNLGGHIIERDRFYLGTYAEAVTYWTAFVLDAYPHARCIGVQKELAA